MSTPEDEGLLSRWSKRKRAVAAEEAAPPPVAAEPEDTELAELEELPEAEVLERLGLPDPDTMAEGDDFKPFLQASVPAYLRKRALRKLWTTNPVLANIDGLVEYGEDYTDAAMVPEVLNTVYQVGKGMVKDILEPDEDTDLELNADIEVTEAEIAHQDDDPIPEDVEHSVESESPEPEIGTATASIDEPLPTEEVVHRPRRMRFQT